MVSALISRLVILIFGTMYPAYSSYKAVKTKDVKEYVKWMMYWIVFALFTSVETFADVLISWMPFYYELKILFVLWLLSPATNGSSILYKKFVHPELMRREQHIDQYLDKVKTQGYSALVQVGTQGFHYAIQTALSSQAKIVDHLRKSYSMNDLSRPAIAGNANRPFVPAEPRIREVDSEEDATDYGEAAVVGAPVNDRTRQQMQNRIPPLAAHHQTDEDDEEERYLHERIAEDNQYLATAAIPPGRSSAAQPGPLPSVPPPMDPYDSRGYNLRSHHILSSSSGVNMAAVPPSGRRSEVPAAAAAAYAQQEAAAVERPYIHEEGYHYGTLPRRRVLASPAGQQQRHSSRASGSRPALPSDWRS